MFAIVSKVSALYFLISKMLQPAPKPVVPAGIAGTQMPGMATQTHPCGLDTGIHAGMTVLAEVPY
jgi:hypothetical protein